jgi:hypothetical protein
MAILSRKSPAAAAFALVQAHNAFLKSFVDNGTTYAHYDITSTPGGDYQVPTSTSLQVSPTGSQADLAHVIIQAEATRAVLLAHFADAVAHKASDATNLALITLAAVPAAVDQTTVNALNVALAAALTAHESQTGIHSHNDTTNITSAAASTSLPTSKTQAADTVTQVNAHITAAPGSVAINFQPA